ncbi:hypothetical protein CONCODRAFT_19202 [Conidiobolus coronatus NRRL 28638]|uniref:Uncharacterized protein n=1 Tax=Conidiobolus coronatus (strain ATCC 28846 / CBS 209.66 / NRRL 28638) TaxID=796925 RepID=A0A137NZ71_CONC2|nr:hypothetical protein CONCODRAFT_19202 [Conidiobolus coronatus NRRL 28638]|eukprot:KXN68125.1 hypothetical protein CONCODRAFT_19202 [Conidiobolus coronatus NRRL 28638]
MSNSNKEQKPSEKLEISLEDKLPQLTPASTSGKPSLKTYKLEQSNILDRINNFLPNLNKTEDLLNMEELNSSDDEVIEMNLGLGVFDVNNPGDEEEKTSEADDAAGLIPNIQRNSPAIKKLKLSKDENEEESTTLWDFIQDPRGEKSNSKDEIILPVSTSNHSNEESIISDPVVEQHHPGIQLLSEEESSENDESNSSSLGSSCSGSDMQDE